MDLTLLRSFVAVAETGSFSGAATKLNLTQSTISHQIARLEQHLGRRLLERTTRKCNLTAAGQALVGRARYLVNQFDELEREYRPEALRGNLRFGISDDYHLFGSVAAAVAEFSREQPLVTIEVRAGLADDLKEGMRAGEIDLALLRQIPSRNPKNAVAVEDLVWIGKESAVSGNRSELTLAMISEPCAYRRTALEALTKADTPYKTVVSCSSLAAVLAFVETGFAISAVIRGSVPRDRDLVIADGLLPPLPRTALVPQFANNRPTALTTALLRKIQERLHNDDIFAMR